MDLNPQQQQAVESAAPLTVVISGPGAGKSRVIVARILHLIRSGVAPERIAAVTFTNQAAKVLQERLDGQGDLGKSIGESVGVERTLAGGSKGSVANGPVHLGFCGTLHSLMLSFVKAHSRALGYPSAITVIAETQANELMHDSMKQCRWTGSANYILRAVAEGIPKGKSLTKAQSVAAHYFQRMQDAGMIDYDSILALGLRAVREFGAGKDFEHFLLDEMQDTSDMDFEIFTALPVANKFAVGDFDQQIYSFRNAGGVASTGFLDLCNDKSSDLRRA